MRWIDQDALGHINNSRYFTYFEQTRVDWLAGLDIEWQQRTGPVLVRAACDFKRAVTFPAFLRVALFAGEPGRSSLPTFYRVYDGAEDNSPCALGEATVVWVDVEKGRPVSLPESVRKAVLAAPFEE